MGRRGANEIGRPFFSRSAFTLAQSFAVSVFGKSGLNRDRNRSIRSRRLAPQFLASIPYAISAGDTSETVSDLPAGISTYSREKGWSLKINEMTSVSTTTGLTKSVGEWWT